MWGSCFMSDINFVYTQRISASNNLNVWWAGWACDVETFSSFPMFFKEFVHQLSLIREQCDFMQGQHDSREPQWLCMLVDATLWICSVPPLYAKHSYIYLQLYGGVNSSLPSCVYGFRRGGARWDQRQPYSHCTRVEQAEAAVWLAAAPLLPSDSLNLCFLFSKTLCWCRWTQEVCITWII